MRPELFALAMTFCAACPPTPGDGTDTSQAPTGCDEPALDAAVPAAWSFCGCSEQSAWREHCGEGFFCEELVEYTSVPPRVLGATCSPLCRSDRDCAAFPFAGAEVVCGGHHCEILCDAGSCPAGMKCQGDNCIHSPGS